MRRFILLVCWGSMTACERCNGAEANSIDSHRAEALGLTTEEAGIVLAKVGETEITLLDLGERLAAESPYVRARYASPERRREYLENMVRFELLAQEAESQGFADRPEVRHATRQLLAEEVIRSEVEANVTLASISDQDIRAYFETHQAEYQRAPQRRASHIQLADRMTAARLLAELKAHPEDVMLFRSLADQHNQDADSQGDRHGDLRFFYADGRRDEGEAVPGPVAQAAFALSSVGELAPEVVESERGFHLVMLTATRDAQSRTLDDVRAVIQNLLWRQKRDQAVEALVERLRRDSQIEENPAALEQVRIPNGEGQ